MLTGCGGGDVDIDTGDISISGNTDEELDVNLGDLEGTLTPNEEADYVDSAVDNDLTADENDAVLEGDGPQSGIQIGTNDACKDLAGDWILNTYTTDITSPAGSITQVHFNSGKTLTLNADCSYVEDYSTEKFVPVRLTQSYADRGMSTAAVSSMLSGVEVEDIVCGYEGQNTGKFVLSPLGQGENVIKFETESTNNISGTCNQNVGGAMRVGDSHHTPGVGNQIVINYEYFFENGNLVLRSGFVPETGTELDITMVFSQG